jgi:hypothetical protein
MSLEIGFFLSCIYTGSLDLHGRNMKYENEILIGISKHMITLSVTIIAGLVAFIKWGGLSIVGLDLAKLSIINSAVTIVSSVVIQVATYSKVANEEKRFISFEPKHPFFVSWLTFIFSGGLGGLFLLKNI